MYYPIQIPYLLNKDFSDTVKYSEKLIPGLQDFVICFWQMQAVSTEKKEIENIIITDGCIDLVADYDGRRIGFAGMNQTEFHFKIQLPAKSFGMRLKPGAFYQITGIHADKAMNTFLPISEMDKDFDTDYFFSLSFDEAKKLFIGYTHRLVQGKPADEFLSLFDRLNENMPGSAAELYHMLHFSPKQTQRLFLKHFGLTPQVVLSILRFQKCLQVLSCGTAAKSDILSFVNYYDQAHFIKDFKRNIGITPSELMRKFK